LVEAEALAQVTGFDGLAGCSHYGFLAKNQNIRLTYKVHLSFQLAQIDRAALLSAGSRFFP
jgi:hypothetical protein